MMVGRFRLKLVHKVVMWTYVICQSFRFNHHFLVEFWKISPSGVPRGWFSVQFWSLFNLSFSNVQLISDKTKTIFVKPYSLSLMDVNISSQEFLAGLWLWLQFSPIWGMSDATGNGLSSRPHNFHAHGLYHKVLVSLRSSTLSLVISRKKY